jgi:hypothetical protein
MATKFPTLPTFTKRFLALLSVVLLTVPALADTSSAVSLPALVPGVYVLDEWHTDGDIFKPPQVEGRFLVMGGTISTVLINNAQAENKTSAIYLGKYTWDGTHFTYGYETTSRFAETPTGITADHKAPFDGMRSFTIQKTAQGTVRLRSDTGQEFVFTQGGARFTDGTTVRVYRRLTTQ